jgi:hypothetical protein
MTDRDRCGLRGSVKSCELHRTWYSGSCGPEACQREERNDVTVVEFRPDGSLQRRWYKSPPANSSEWTNSYEYHDANQLTAECAGQGETVTITKLCEYDATGRILQITMPDKNRQPRVAETYSYDVDGRKKKIVHIDPALPSGDCGTMFGLDGTDAAYGSPGAASITSFYDERGRPCEHLFHDSGGELITRIDLRHDERGNLVEEVCSQHKLPSELIDHFSAEQLGAAQLLFSSSRHHRYDEQDRRIETSSKMAPKDVDVQTFAYNEHGDLITEISESSHAEYDFGEDGRLTPKPDSARSHRSEAQFRYQYDPHGNWIEKIVETPGGTIWSLGACRG